MRRLSTTYKLTLLLALLSTVPMVAHVFNGARQELQERMSARMASCQQLALSCALHLRDKDYSAIKSLLAAYADRSQSRRVRLVRFDGLVVQDLGVAFEERFQLNVAPESANDIRIPISRAGRAWGTLQIVYPQENAYQQIFPMARACVTTFFLNLFMFGILLRRALAVIDTGKAVPKRVRNTLDTIAGGVVILDGKRRIVMANEAFQKSSGMAIEDLLGKPLTEIEFINDEDGALPWDEAIDHQERQAGVTIYLRRPESEERCFVVNATPIFDSKDELAGVLVSFEDVTTLEQQRQSLVRAMSELEASKEKIRKQNVKLQELASKDGLTGLFNRRSLFEQFERLWEDRENNPLNCIMLDVDHFKKLNDNYGHAVGDDVLRNVARTLQECTMEPAFVGRYGGEEFCVVLPGMSVAEAVSIGETIRRSVEENLAEPYHVTASFGVSGTELGASNYQDMLEQADQALYHAKDGGRNAVCCWSAELAAEEPSAESEVQLPTTGRISSDQPISYHAVASLHAALAYRDADTALHSQRVAELAVALGRDLMSVGELYILEIAGTLHDIGKVGVPDAILLKPGKLTEEEWHVMNAHARMGVEIVDSSFDSQELSDIIRYHHYRYDGAGTPAGEPVGEDIPLGARILTIVDAFDAMVSNRVYRKGRSAEEAFAELQRCAGTQFDPDLVERFIGLKTGWRVDSRFFQNDFDDKLAISIGHLTERTLHAFEARERSSLENALLQLERTAAQSELPAISHLSEELRLAVAEEASDEWQEFLPILQNLLEMSMSVQRAHIRGVASRPQVTEDCPQQSYYSLAREWLDEQLK